jgi:hypothetical protein
MATEQQRARLRADLAADATALTDGQIDEFFARAAEVYSDPRPAEAYTRLLALRGWAAAAAKRADVTQGASGERLAQIFAHIERLRAHYEAELMAVRVQVAWGRLRKDMTHDPR